MHPHNISHIPEVKSKLTSGWGSCLKLSTSDTHKLLLSSGLSFALFQPGLLMDDAQVQSKEPAYKSPVRLKGATAVSAHEVMEVHGIKGHGLLMGLCRSG